MSINLLESLLCFKRAGADMIFTYGAIDAALHCEAEAVAKPLSS